MAVAILMGICQGNASPVAAVVIEVSWWVFVTSFATS